MSELGPTLGWEVIDWIEEYLCHGPGDVQGQPIVLDDEFARFILKAYEVFPKGHPREGRRRRHRAFLSRAKGRAKSELGGMLACVEALGPVRFDGWGADGRPIGRPVTSPEILCFATEEDQAGNTYGNVAFMLEHGRVANEYRYDLGRSWQTSSRVLIDGGGTIEPVTSAATSKDGGKSTFVVWDELHLWYTPQLRALYNTVRRNLGKRKAADPWGLGTSTMYRPGQGSVAEDLHAQWRKNPDGTLLFDHVEGPECDLSDDDALRAALAVAYGAASPWMDFDRMIEEEFRTEGVSLDDSVRYFLNRRVDHESHWIPIDVYDRRVDAERRIRKGARITIGFDGSDRGTGNRRADSTVLRGCDVETGHRFTLGMWEHPEDVDEWEVPRGEVRAAVRQAFADYDVVRMYGDPPYWHTELDEWAGEYGAERVTKWRTDRDQLMAQALELLSTSIHSGTSTHDDDPRVRAHYANARRNVKPAPKTDPDGRHELVLVRKESPSSPLKIDSVIADALALRARSDVIAEGALKPKEFVTIGFGGRRRRR